MVLRHLRWPVACLAAVVALCSSPGRSSAEVQILVQELSGTTVVGSSNFSVGTPDSGFFSQSFSYTSPSGYFTVTGGQTTTNSLSAIAPSLSTSFNVGVTNNFVSADNHTLRITVTDDRFTGGGAGTLNNGVAIPLGLTDANLGATAFARVYDPNQSPPVTQASSTTARAGYLTSNTAVEGTNLAVTGTAADERPRTDPDESNTTVNVSGLPSPFAIQQVINVAVTGPDSIKGKTFTVNASANIDPSAVPAPGGLALALIGLPLVGLRRVLRKRAAA